MSAYLVFILILLVVGIIPVWMVYKKAGKPGWAAIIPIYNFYILLDIVGRPVWWLVFLLLPVVPFVGPLAFLIVWIIVMLDLAKRFNKSTVFAVVGLVIFHIIGMYMLAFGDAKYKAVGSKK
ncbi:signal peptidase I [Candidatus Saccharibacteria bacterium]|nr:signal peptidase I [Candidatus Saccharibacteria bacterium]